MQVIWAVETQDGFGRGGAEFQSITREVCELTSSVKSHMKHVVAWKSSTSEKLSDLSLSAAQALR
jgi:hypothetical protein